MDMNQTKTERIKNFTSKLHEGVMTYFFPSEISIIMMHLAALQGIKLSPTKERNSHGAKKWLGKKLYSAEQGDVWETVNGRVARCNERVRGCNR